MAHPHFLRVISPFQKDNCADFKPEKAVSVAKKVLGIDAFEKIDEISSPKRDFKRDYEARFSSLCDSLAGFLESLPSNYPYVEVYDPRVIREVISQFKKDFGKSLPSSDKDSKPYQEILQKKTTLLLEVLQVQFSISQTTADFMTELAEKYMLLQQIRPDLTTISRLTKAKDSVRQKTEHFYVIQRENPLDSFSPKVVEDLWAIKTSENDFPKWYQILDPFERLQIRRALDKLSSPQDINEQWANLSSRLRSLPALSNYRVHESYLTDEEGHLIGKPSYSIASSIVSSRAMVNESEDIRLFHTVNNIVWQVEQNYKKSLINKINALKVQPKNGETISLPFHFLLQTLISPLNTLGMTPDQSVDADKNKAIPHAEAMLKEFFKHPVSMTLADGRSVKVQVDFSIISTNHPLNYAEQVIPTAKDDKHCLKLIKTVEHFITAVANTEQIRSLNALITEYKEALADYEWPRVSKDPVKRELYLASVEQLMIMEMNDERSGSCMSAKDRKPVEFIHTDSMIDYHGLYGSWPAYYSGIKDRDRFTSIFAHLYLTRHHHESAGFNAPGACGTKTPNMYLPQDIADKINSLMKIAVPMQENPLKDDNRIAGNNDIAKIVGHSKLGHALGVGLKKMGWLSKDKADSEALAILRETARDFLSVHEVDRSEGVSASATAESIRACLDMVAKIIVHSSWKGKGTHVSSWLGKQNEPEGILNLRKCLHQGRKISSAELPAMFQEVVAQSLKKSFRHSDTKVLYSSIKTLLLLADYPSEIASAEKSLAELYRKLYRQEPTHRQDTTATINDCFSGIPL